MLKINGVEITTPKTFKADVSDIDGETNRDANALLHRDRIAVKRKLYLGWQPLTNEEISPILKAVQDEFFEVEYPDPMEGKMLTKTFYVSDRSAAVYSCIKGVIKWTDLTMNFIER